MDKSKKFRIKEIKTLKQIILTLCIVLSSYTIVLASPDNNLPKTINHPNVVQAVGTIEVAFSPNGGAEQAICNELNNAHQSILVQAYSFTNNSIGKALVAAKQRGVDVRCVVDESQEHGKYSLIKMMRDNNIPVHIDRTFAISHSKVMIIDNKDIITGSYNFSSGAEHKNAENLLIIRGDDALTALYLDNLNWRWEYTENLS